MRILYFTRDYTPHDVRFLSALAKTEHQVYYLRLERQGNQLEDRPLPPQIEYIPWKGGHKPFNLKDFPRLWLNLKGVIRKVQPDLIHAGPIQTSAFLSALCGFRPLVSMSWGYDLLCDAERNALWRWVTRYTLARSTVLIGDCDTMRKRAIAYGMKTERIVTFPWGVDLKHFAPARSEEERMSFRRRWGWGKEDFVLLSVRAWEPSYGVLELAHAFVQVSREFPQVRLMMLGNGSLASKIHRIFLENGLLDRVHFPGQVRQEHLPKYYQSADVYLSASHSDGTSISLLEAMACGCPVLVSDIPGNREWVDDGVQGWLFKTGDIEDLVNGIHRAIGDRERMIQMGKAARCTAEQRADWSRNFLHLLEAYQLAMDIIGKPEAN